MLRPKIPRRLSLAVLVGDFPPSLPAPACGGWFNLAPRTRKRHVASVHLSVGSPLARKW